MEMSLQENPKTSGWWFNKPTTNDTVEVAAYEREPMFEKPLTPSDVGKLNRLVIPKQHAEKHFPLAGTLLAFEDEAGKCWRFRYSYWNSSQSYVLTKGWSRYVKEKRLDAGDVLYFERHRAQPERTFIGCRRRDSSPAAGAREAAEAAAQQEGYGHGERSNSRRLVRLFGVNLECQQYHQTTSSEMSFLSAQQQQQQQQH